MKDEFMYEDITKEEFDREFQKNREDWALDPEGAHERQVQLVKRWDAKTGKDSYYDEATGIWELSDGRRSDEIGMGLKGNSTMSPAFNYEEAEGYVDLEKALKKYEDAEFTYDPESDKKYKNYVNKMEREGKKAMEDTLGKLSSMTGGVAGSYAVSAASGEYNDYMEEAADKMTDFYKMAYDEFLYEQDKNLKEIALAEEKIRKEEEIWEKEKEALEEEETENKAKKSDYILMMQDFQSMGWEALSRDQKLLAIEEGCWYDPSTGILYDAAGNSYLSNYDPVENAVAIYKTNGIKALSAADVDYLENAGYKIRDGILYGPDWREV